MVRTEGLTHIHLLVSDLSRSLAFYQQVFGLEEMFREGPNMVFLSTPGRSDTITLNQDPDQGKGRVGDSGGIAHFGFRLADDADLEVAIEEVRAAGGRLVSRGEHSPGEPYAYVTDPDGYVIEL
jgi:catechol 2,3-dioxygenase-like lactoylglutathione lyase family enzyme